MPTVHELFSEEFYQWESRGRGWQVFEHPVYPEPPFRPFKIHSLPTPSSFDDGRVPTFLSSLIGRLSERLSTQPPQVEVDEEEPEPELLYRGSLFEIKASLPVGLKVNDDVFEHFLLSLSLCREPIAFEILGVADRLTIQFVVDGDEAAIVRRQLSAHFPEAVFDTEEHTLDEAWQGSWDDEVLLFEFGLAKEFVFPLALTKTDPFVGVCGALSELQRGELGLFQIIFAPTQKEWTESIIRSVTHSDGSEFFVNRPELAHSAKGKTRSPLFSAVVRIAVKSESFVRATHIARDLAGAISVFRNPQGNELIPLENSNYPFQDHVEDLLKRQSRRSGMILNTEELLGFVHLPGSDVRSPKLTRETGRTKAAPQVVQKSSGLLLGINSHALKSIEVRLDPEQRVRHMHVIGASGTGKSTLLYNLIRQDIENGQGVAVLDPHGDLIDRVLLAIPRGRIDDVVLVDPSDEEFSVGFNILSAHSDLEKNLLSSDLVSVFRRLSTSWGDQLGSVLQNAILAFLESDRGGTLADLRRFLIEPAFRDQFLKSVRDPAIVYYWRKGFTQLAGNKSIGSVITRLETFLAPKAIRYMVSQRENRLDFGNIIDSGKIFLAKLPQGQMGKENAFLLGSFFVSKFQQLAMSRQAKQISARRDFWLYIDEFHEFITPSMTEILTSARKYRLGLILAHQELRQLDRERELASAVLTHPFTRIVFRVGDSDARALENGFSFFEARDLQNLETGRAICRFEKADGDFNVSVPKALEQAGGDEIRKLVVAESRAKYAVPRAQVEAEHHASFIESQPIDLRKEKVSKPEAKIPTADALAAPTAPPAAVPDVKPSLPKEPPSVQTSETKGPDKESQPLKPAEMGRGGAQFHAVKDRLIAEARKLGFGTTIEKEIKGTREAIDILFERGDLKIACEISFSTTVDHEVGNVRKCMKAGYSRVCVICTDEQRLGKIQEAVTKCFSANEASYVRFFVPESMLAHLKSLSAAESLTTPPPSGKTTVLGKYKVKTKCTGADENERKAKEQSVLQALAEAMKSKIKFAD